MWYKDSIGNSDPLGSSVQRSVALCGTQMGTQPFSMQYIFISFRIQYFFISFRIQHSFSFFTVYVGHFMTYRSYQLLVIFSMLYISICSTATTLCISFLYCLTPTQQRIDLLSSTKTVGLTPAIVDVYTDQEFSPEWEEVQQEPSTLGIDGFLRM